MRTSRWLVWSVIGMFAAACGDDAPTEEDLPPSGVVDGNGWRTVTVFPDPDDLRFWGDPILPSRGYWLGDNHGEVHFMPVWVNLGGEQFDDFRWFTFDGERTAPARPHEESGRYLARVYDRPDRYYFWDGLDLKASSDGDPFSGSGEVLYQGATPDANRDLDIIVHAPKDDSARGIYVGPVLFSKENGGVGVNAALDRQELVLPRDHGRSTIYYGHPFAVFNPVDGPARVFQIGRYGRSVDGERVMLQVFATSTDPSGTYPLYRTLRRIRSYPITITVQVAVQDPTTVLRLLATPTNAWIVLDDQVAKTWSIYRFDRATDELVFERTMPWPIDPTEITIESEVITDDGTIYLYAANRSTGVRRIVRIADETVTDIWGDAIAKTQPPTFTGGLYSTGARIYAVLMDWVKDPVNGLDRPRFTVITPTVPAVAAALTPALPAPFVPPAPCNPLTNVPCAAGEACDVGPSTNGFACAPSGPAPLCGACDPIVGPFCGPGYTCRTTGTTERQCVKMCCDFDDCGGSCSVEASRFDFPVGFCAATTLTPQCNAANIPAVPPSGGSCSN